ncbi:DUF488 domain-containing protein [Paenibacillus sp. CN-4]|uniref:DUF488 domain-containing protein n=1 Tax=Paenibacillus nanchangensis TaxID=3348343 RepID=UPI0039788A06
MTKSALQLRLKRVYDPPNDEDGCRILIDRLWPRGLTKEQAAIQEWMKEIAPDPELRRWFGHKPERFGEFRKRYLHELAESEKKAELVQRIRKQAAEERVTLVYGAKDPVHNHGVVLLDYVWRREK